MREVKEILQLTLRKFDKLECSGLCNKVKELFDYGEISFEERLDTVLYIEMNRPKPRSLLYSKENARSAYYWPIRDQRSRKLWLVYHIVKLTLI